MIVLQSTDTLRIVCTAIPTTELSVWSSWADEGALPAIGRTSSATNGTTSVNIVAAPAASYQRVVKSVIVANPNVVSSEVTLSIFDGVNTRIIKKDTIAAGGSKDFLGDLSVIGLATVATTGLYSSLSGLPTLGTISTQNANAVAITGGSLTGLTTVGTPQVQATTSAGLSLKNNAGSTVATLGAGGGLGSTFNGQINGTSVSLSGSITATGGTLSGMTSIATGTLTASGGITNNGQDIVSNVGVVVKGGFVNTLAGGDLIFDTSAGIARVLSVGTSVPSVGRFNFQVSNSTASTLLTPLSVTSTGVEALLTTDSTSPTSAASIKTAGGISCAKNISLGGALKLGNTAVAATPTATHTMTIQDATGTTYRVLCVV